MDILRVYSAHSRKKTTLNFLDAYNFLKVQFVRNKLKTGKEYVSFHLREIRPTPWTWTKNGAWKFSQKVQLEQKFPIIKKIKAGFRHFQFCLLEIISEFILDKTKTQKFL